MSPWNNWYHCTIHTYGTWLRGDPRGWRARHHREHVDGDYKHPPPKGKYDALYEYSKSLMKRDPVRIERELRSFVLDAFIDKLQTNHVPVAVASLDSTHLHVLIQCPDRNPRHWLGLSKKHSSHCVRALSLAPPGGLWQKRSHPEPISNPAHFDRTLDYIHKHAKKGAAVWLEPTPTEKPIDSMEDFDPNCLLIE
jgi:REP element-mobilizing transposase RayT